MGKTAIRRHSEKDSNGSFKRCELTTKLSSQVSSTEE